MAEEKIQSRTEEFKELLQNTAAEILGKKISKKDVWTLFKAFYRAPFEMLLTNYKAAGSPAIKYGAKIPELSLSLSGVGAFRIIPVGGEEKTSVKPRFYISSSLENAVKVALGFAAEEAEETEEVAAADDTDLDI